VSRGVGANRLVGICVERGMEMVIALLGVLKAGAAYVPLDPYYPSERVAYMLQDSSPEVILIQTHLRTRLPETAAQVFSLDDQWDEIARCTATNPDNPVQASEQLAYVIYTSGSSGKPKGVMVTHGNVVRLFESTWSWFRFDKGDVWTLFHSFAFDFSVWEMW